MRDKDQNKSRERGTRDANRDPITGAPGSHPVGTGIGAAAGGLAGAGAGAAIGAAAGTATGGPIGTAIGGVAGAIAGAAGGHAVGEAVNPSEEEAYWKENHTREPYYQKNYVWDDYGTAYRTGYEGYSKWGGSHTDFTSAEPNLRSEYEANRGKGRMDWDRARPAVQAAWARVAGRQHTEGRDLESLIDADVLDIQSNKVGTLKCIWSDERGEPEFIGVSTGWFFGKTHVVPAQKVHVSERSRRIRLPYTEDKVKEAPSYEADVDLTDQIQNDVWRHYGISHETPPPSARSHSSETPRTATMLGAEQQHEDVRKHEHAEIPLAEETLKVGKREVEAGGVRLRKIVRTEIVNQPVELKREEIVIERVPSAEVGSTATEAAFTEEDVYIPLRREEAVVEKETKVREVVRARKQSQADRQEVREKVRKEDVEIESTGEARRTEQPPGARRTPGPAEEIAGREEVPRSRRIK